MSDISLLLLTHHNEFVLFKRSADNTQHKNMYGFIGGGIEGDETPEEAVKREAKEETGIIIDNIKYIKKYDYEGKTIHLFYTNLKDLSGIKLNSEHTGYKLFTPEETKDKSVISTTPQMIADYEKKHNIIKELYNNLDGNDDILDQGGDNFSQIKMGVTIGEDGSTMYSTQDNVGGNQYATFNNTGSDDDSENYSNDELLERRTAWINGSIGVTVKDGCRLGGGKICNQGDINNFNFHKLSLREGLLEDFDPEDGYTDMDTMTALVNGTKGVATVMLTPSNEKFILKNKLNVIMIIPQHHNMYIVYKDQKDKALKVFNYLKTHDGYFDDKTPEQAWEIGKLLDYEEYAIKKYIKRIYIDKVDAYGRPFPEDRFDKNLTVDPKFLEENTTDEGVGDKYLEKKYNFEPEFSEFDKQYRSANTKRDEIVYSGKNGLKNFVIIKNPSNINILGPNVRGIIDKNGNLYVEQNSIITHEGIIGRLEFKGLVRYNGDWDEVIGDFITVQRNGNENLFLAGESNNMLTPPEDPDDPNYYKLYKIYENNTIKFQEYLNRAKKINPNINFIPTLIHDYKHGMNESEIILNNINEARNLI